LEVVGRVGGDQGDRSIGDPGHDGQRVAHAHLDPARLEASTTARIGRPEVGEIRERGVVRGFTVRLDPAARRLAFHLVRPDAEARDNRSRVHAAPLDAGVRNLAWMRRGIDFNPDAALFKKARELKLGYPLSGEFGFKDESGNVYVAQMFAGGITYCIVGDYGNIKVASWL